jgi:hypothetical protein
LLGNGGDAKASGANSVIEVRKMAKKSKPTKKKAIKKKIVKKKAAKKAAPAKKSLSKAKAKAKPKMKAKGARKAARRTVEPSSGSASSSLDPRRAGRLQLRDPGTSARRERIGDLQGISMEERADSESVGELLEEGQTLEAEAVQAIEDAPDADQGEIRTREVPEDDVPEEYLDQD